MRYMLMACFLLVAFIAWNVLYITARYAGVPYWLGLVGSIMIGFFTGPQIQKVWHYLPKVK